MRHKHLHIAHKTLFAVGATFLVALFAIQANLFAEGGNEIPFCAGVDLVNPNDGHEINGAELLQVVVDPSLQPSHVKFFANTTFLGEASNDNSPATEIYEYMWTPASTTVGEKNIYAKLYFGTASSGSTAYPNGCKTESSQVVVTSNTQATYELGLVFETTLGENSSWSGPVNTSTTFKVRAIERVNGAQPTNVTDSAELAWSTTKGKVTKDSNGRAVFFTGPEAGTGKITVKARKNGQTATRYIYVNVLKPISAATYPADGSIDGSTTETNKESNLDETETTKQFSLGDQELENCIVEKLGEDYRQKLNEGYRLKLSELSLIKSCTAARKNVLPPNLAPVAPEKVRELKESSIAKIANIKEAALANQEKGIQLSGTAKALSEVVLYIYSEPLVLTTDADENGNWSYTLDSPLEPGEHEVFVTVEDDDGEIVRSSGFNFSVAQVAATDDNPQGLSLALVGQQDDNTSRLLGLSMVVVLVGVFVVVTFIAIKNKKHHHPDMKPEQHGVSRKA